MFRMNSANAVSIEKSPDLAVCAAAGSLPASIVPPTMPPAACSNSRRFSDILASVAGHPVLARETYQRPRADQPTLRSLRKHQHDPQLKAPGWPPNRPFGVVPQNTSELDQLAADRHELGTAKL